MVTTKDRILAEALRQLNQEGIGSVSIRSIAGALEMSAGNLTYHFKNIDAIIQQLYLNLVAEVNGMLAGLNPTTLDMGIVFESVRLTCGIMYRYRFILLDFAQIGRRVPGIRDHFRSLVNVRLQEFAFFNDVLQQLGYLKAERVPGQFDVVTLQMIILGNSWVIDAAIHFPEDTPPEALTDFYARLMLGYLAPSLTDKGLQELLAHTGDLRALRYPGANQTVLNTSIFQKP
jgi:AcrR family transcriptional regulator